MKIAENTQIMKMLKYFTAACIQPNFKNKKSENVRKISIHDGIDIGVCADVPRVLWLRRCMIAGLQRLKAKMNT